MASGDRIEARLCAPTQLGTSTTTLFTVTTSHTFVAKQIIITNTDTVDRAFSLAIGSAATASNRVISTLPIGANDVMVWDTALVLTSGETFQGLADTASKVNVTVIGWDKTD
jgi:hypothetical protein